MEVRRAERRAQEIFQSKYSSREIRAETVSLRRGVASKCIREGPKIFRESARGDVKDPRAVGRRVQRSDVGK